MSNLKTIFRRDAFPAAKRAFMIMPFCDPFDKIYETVILPTVESAGFKCVRGDDIYSDRTIIGDIWHDIQSAEIIIADLSERNPNVMYELGLSHAIWRKTVLLVQSEKDVPFDLKSLRYIQYDPIDREGFASKLKKAINAISTFPVVDPIWDHERSIFSNHAFFSDDIDGTEFDWSSLTARSSSELHLFGPTLSFWFSDPRPRSALLQHIQAGRALSVYLSTWEPIVAFGGSGPDDLKKTISRLIAFRDSLTDSQRDLLTIRFHHAVSTLSGVICDPDTDTGMLVLTLRLADDHNSAGRYFVGLRREVQPSLYDMVMRKLFNVRYLGNDFTPEQMLQRGLQLGYISAI